MMARFAALCLILVGLMTCSTALFAQTPPKADETPGYIGVGRIKWNIPRSFEYTFAVPHFSVGPRIKCTGSQRDCEILVASRDISVSMKKRRDVLTSKLEPYVERSKEKVIRMRTFGVAPEVTYATLTDSRPAPGEFRLLTFGFSVNGTAVIHFQHLTNNANDIQKMLDVVQAARTIDALGIWAWKLRDYKIVCEERFPAYKNANDAAFRSSPFSSVDIIGFWQSLPTSESREEIQRTLDVSRASYAKSFDERPLLEKQGFCGAFPSWVAEAAKDVSMK